MAAALPLPQRRGLVHCLGGRDVRIADCEITGSGGNGIWLEQVSGDISGNIFTKIATTAVVSFDAQGLIVSRNTIIDTNDNGIEILRTAIGDDGTLVLDNRIEDIKAGPGGSGQYGNAINAFRAGNVIVRGNRIRNCDYSAVRGNSASNIQIIRQQRQQCPRGRALFGVRVRRRGDRQQHRRWRGRRRLRLQFQRGRTASRSCRATSSAICCRSGRSAPRRTTMPGSASMSRRTTSVTGNVIENAPSFGIIAGWGKYLRDVAITGNVIRKAFVGIGVSVMPGAGTALVNNNMISETPRGAVVGLDHARTITTDLAAEGAQRYAQVAVGGNAVRR